MTGLKYIEAFRNEAQKAKCFADNHYDEATLNKGLQALANIDGGAAMAMDMVQEYARKMAEYEFQGLDMGKTDMDVWSLGMAVNRKFNLMKAVGDLNYAFEDQGINKLSSNVKAAFASGVNSVIEQKYPHLDMTNKWQGPNVV